MSDLTVSIIVRMINRLGAPAAAARRSLAGLATGQAAIAKSGVASAKATDQASKAAVGLKAAAAAAAIDVRKIGAESRITATAADGLSAAAKGASIQFDDLSRTAAQAYQGMDRAASGANAATSAMSGLDRSTSSAARKMTLLERAERMASGASRRLKTDAGELERQLGGLAKASLAVEGIARGGRMLGAPLMTSVERQADIERHMTGIGIVGDLRSDQLPMVQANIIAQAQKLALPIDTILQDDMAVLNEGVYRDAKSLIAASRSAAGLSLLADIDGSPLQGPEAGAMIATYAHALQLPANQLESYNAILAMGSKLGGDKIGDVARFMPVVMAQLKGRAFGNKQGFIDAVAAFQIVKRVAGSDEQAGTDLRDLMTNLTHRLTRLRFKKAGVDIDEEIAQGEKKGRSPLQTVIDVLLRKIGDDPNDPKLTSKLGEFFNSQWAGQGALALLQYTRDGSQGIGFDTMRSRLAAANTLANYRASIQRASTGSFADIQRANNSKDAAAISTGAALKPATHVASGVVGGIFDAIAGFMSHGVVGKAAAIGVAGVAGLASGAGAVGQGIIGIVGPMIILKELTKKTLPDLIKLGSGKLLSGLIRSGGALRGVFGGALAGVRLLGGGLIGMAARALPVAIAGAWELTAALALNPITLIVAGVATLGVAAYLLIKNWGKVKAFFADLWAGIGEKIKAIVAAGSVLLGHGGTAAASPSHAAALASIRAGVPGATAPAKAGGGVHIGKVEQHFHLPNADPKAVVDQANKAGGAGVRRALHDAADG